MGMVDLSKGRVFSSLSFPVTITSTLGTILLSPSMTLIVDDWLIVNAHVHTTKGGSSGKTKLKIKQDSGTADFDWLPFSGKLHGDMESSVPANGEYVKYFSFMVRCTQAGTAVISITGQSIGSDSTVEAGGAAFNIEMLKA